MTVDASALIAFLDPTDVHHADAVDALASAEPPLYVHPLTLAEVLVAPTRHGIAEQVVAELAAIGVTVDDTPIDPLDLARVRVDSGCKMPDCCVLATAGARQTDIITFDQRLAHAHANRRR